jgi:hypothetical protein
MGRAPQWIFTAHPSNQIADLARNPGPTGPAMPDLPNPEKAKSLAMPGDRRRGFEDVQRRTPVASDTREENPKQTVDSSQFRASSADRFRTPIWCRRAMFSNSSAARERN